MIKKVILKFTVVPHFTVISFIFLYFLPDLFIRGFTTNQELIDLTVHAAKRIFFFLYLVGIAFVGMMTFQALGKAAHAIVSSLARPVLFLIPLVIIFSRFFGIDGVWWGFAITDAMTTVVVIIMLIPQLREFQKNESELSPKNTMAAQQTDPITQTADL